MSDLLPIAEGIVAQATGAEHLDVMLARGRSTSVRVYGGEVEAFTSAESFGAGVRVIRDGRVGFAHAGSLDPDVLRDTLAEARDNVAFSATDEFVGLADPDGVDAVVHDQWNDDIVSMAAPDKIARTIELERLTLGLDQRITGVRVAAWSDSSGETAYAASNGLRATDRGTSCSMGVQPLARDGDETQIGYAGDGARRIEDLDIADIAARAVEKATRLLGATKPGSAKVTILLEPKLAATILGIVSGMLDGESVLKGRSPFAGRVDEQIASPLLRLVDDPTRAESLGAECSRGFSTTATPDAARERRRPARRCAARVPCPVSAPRCWWSTPVPGPSTNSSPRSITGSTSTASSVCTRA